MDRVIEGLLSLTLGREAAQMIERLRQACTADRLQQIIHRMEFKCLYGVLIVRGTEHDMGPRLREARGHIEARAAGHLDVEQNHIGMEISGHLHGLRSALGFAADFDVGVRARGGTVSASRACLEAAPGRRQLLWDLGCGERPDCFPGRCTPSTRYR